MKKIYHKLTTLLLAGTLCIGMASAAFAADTITYTGVAGQKFGFTPDTPADTSYYTETDLFENFKNVMPGDNLAETVTIQNDNKDSDYIKVYMDGLLHDSVGNPISAKVLNELTADERREDTELAYMHDFLSQLNLTVKNGDTVVYSGSPNELTSGFEGADPVYLAKISKGGSTTLDIALEVPLELNNEYANRIGEVDWVFLIEEGNDGGGGGGGGGDDDTVSRTVYKIWQDSDAGKRPDSITVTLTGTDKQTGKVIEEKTETLNAENQWTASWTGLDSFCQWTIEEQNIPDGYNATYTISPSGNVVTITNDDGSGDTPGSTTPDTPGPTPGGDTPGTDDPDDPVFTSDLTVIKAWDDDNNPDRPGSVTLQLYNGTAAVDTITLTEADGWRHTWDDLAADGQWRVIEVDIPDGYTPVYSAADGVITITNTASLIDTGQMNWPIPILGGLGVLAMASGIVLMRKKKDDHAAE